MIEWKPVPEVVEFNLRRGEGAGGTDFGVSALMDRASTYVIHHSFRQINWTIENVRFIYICVDWNMQESIAISRSLIYKWRAVYRPMKTEKRLDDVYELWTSLVGIDCSKIYSPNRSVLGERLIGLMGKSWKQSWEFYHDCNYGPNPRIGGRRFRIPWWPVRIWLHGRPELAYDLTEAGELVEVPGGLGVDEAQILGDDSDSTVNSTSPQSAPVELRKPSPPRDLEVGEGGLERVVLRWLGSEGADAYEIEWTSDGEDFGLLDLVEGEAAVPDPTGRCTWIDRYPNPSEPDETHIDVAYYRVRARQGHGDGPLSEPSNVVRVDLRAQ